MTSTPMVSVIMPVYNFEQYIQQSIDSVCSSSFRNLELIIIDDGSTDGTQSICVNAKQADERISYFCLEHGGVSNARNMGIKNAKGKFLFFVDADDLIHENLIEILYEMAEKYNADLVCEKMRAFSEEKPEDEPFDERLVYRYGTRTEILDSMLANMGCLGHIGGCMVRRDIVNFEFDTKYYRGEDTLFVYHCCLNANTAVYVKQGLYYYRQHSSNAIHNNDIENVRNMMACYNAIVESEKKAGRGALAAAWSDFAFRNVSNKLKTAVDTGNKTFINEFKISAGTDWKQMRELLTTKEKLKLFVKLECPWLYKNIRRIKLTITGD